LGPEGEAIYHLGFKISSGMDRWLAIIPSKAFSTDFAAQYMVVRGNHSALWTSYYLHHIFEKDCIIVWL
jgi:hypothetical protein